MAKLKLKIAKIGCRNPNTKEPGFTTRVVTNGTASYEDIMSEVCHNTTLHRAEAKVAIELFMEGAAEMLKQGFIVDFGPVGRLYPSCSSGWHRTGEELKLNSVVPSLYYRPAPEVTAAIKGATLQWAREEGKNEEENQDRGVGYLEENV